MAKLDTKALAKLARNAMAAAEEALQGFVKLVGIEPEDGSQSAFCERPNRVQVMTGTGRVLVFEKVDA